MAIVLSRRSPGGAWRAHYRQKPFQGQADKSAVDAVLPGLVAGPSSDGSCPVASPSGFGFTHPPVGNPFRLQAGGD